MRRFDVWTSAVALLWLMVWPAALPAHGQAGTVQDNTQASSTGTGQTVQDATPDKTSAPVTKGGKASKKDGAPKVAPPVGVVLPMILAYTPWHGLVAVNGLANGNNPGRFIVATGLNMSVVSPDDTTRMQLTTSETKANVTVMDASTSVPTATIKALRLGPGVLHNIEVGQVDLLSLISRDAPVDAPTCWLGTNWLSDYQVTFDFESRTLILNRKEMAFTKPQGSNYIVPFKLKNGRPIVKVTIPGGGSFNAVLDTGSLGTLIPSTIAMKLKAKADKDTKKKKDKSSKPAAEITIGNLNRLLVPSIALGKAELKNMVVAYYDASAPASADKTMAIVGVDFLRRFHVTISYLKSQIQLLPLQSDTPPPPVVPVVPRSNKLPGSQQTLPGAQQAPPIGRQY